MRGLRLAGLLFAIIGFLVVASPASAVVVRLADHHFFGVAPRRGVSPTAIPGSLASRQASPAVSGTGNLVYHGGRVLHSSAPYLIFWTPSGESIAASSEALLERYFADVAADSGTGSNVYAVGRQFTDSTGFADAAQTFSVPTQAIVDTQGYPARNARRCKDTGEPTCVTDAQLQTEVQRLITADGLPDDGSASAGALPPSAPIYFVVLPADVNVCIDATTCSDSTFCAYHSAFVDSAGNNVLYAAIPTVLAATDPKSCQFDGNSAVQEPNADMADVVIKYLSHEDNETITDPLGTAWFSPSGNEDGDNCNFTGPFDPNSGENPDAFTPTLGGSATPVSPATWGTLYNQLIDGDQYYIQSEWSNGDGNCEMQPTAGTAAPSFATSAGPAVAGSALTFDPTGTTSTNPISSVTWDFGDGTAPAFSAGSPIAISHTYAAPGTYDVKLTVVDDRGNLGYAFQRINVYDYPTAAFSFGPSNPVEGAPVQFDASGSFDAAPAGIQSYSWDFGDGTSGSGATPIHIYNIHGTYIVSLTVTNAGGLADSISEQVTVGEAGPTAAFTVARAPHAAGVPVTFDGAASKDLDAAISLYSWSFGDGTSGTGVSARHAYRAAGTYSVSLTVTDSAGRSSTTIERLVVVEGTRITKIFTRRRRSIEYLVITVDGPGVLSFGRRRVTVRKPETIRVPVMLTGAQRRTLRRVGRETVRIAVDFAPTVGLRSRIVETIRLHG